MMMGNKAIKMDLYEKPESFFSKLIGKIKMLYYRIYDFFRKYYDRIIDFYQWGKFGMTNFDWDHSFALSLMVFKLKRVKKALINGHAIQEKEDMDALDEVIAIYERLANGNYEDTHLAFHDEKWGEIQLDTRPVKDENGKITHYQWISWRVRASTKEKRELERVEYRECHDRGETDRLADHDRLNELLKKYSNRWWD